MPAISAPVQFARITRAKTYIARPAIPNWSTVKTPKALEMGNR